MNTVVEPNAGATNAPALERPSAAERIALSRERLREAMRDKSASQSEAADTNAHVSSAAWIDKLKILPGTSILLNTLSVWWEHHPMHVLAIATTDATKAVIKPAAQRHPIALVIGAAAMGGIFAWSRPWRWVLKPALAMGLITRLVSEAIPHIPSESWSAALSALLKLQSKSMPAKNK